MLGGVGGALLGVGGFWKVVMKAFLWCRGVLMCVLGALGGAGGARGCFGGVWRVVLGRLWGVLWGVGGVWVCWGHFGI